MILIELIINTLMSLFSLLIQVPITIDIKISLHILKHKNNFIRM
jgi:hypothetical protein